MKKVIISAFILSISSTAFAEINNQNIFLDPEASYHPSLSVDSNKGVGEVYTAVDNTFIDPEGSYIATSSTGHGSNLAGRLSDQPSVGSVDKDSYLNNIFLNADR